MSLAKNVTIADPPCFAPFSANAVTVGKKGKRGVAVADESELERIATRKSNELKLRKAWEVALAPAKSLPMQAIMLYMSGSGIQIFSMGIVWMLLTSPFKACMNIIQTFEPYKQVVPSNSAKSSSSSRKGIINQDLLTTMIVYVGCQALVLACGVWKCKQMGLVPMGTGDWLQFETRSEAPEWSAVRFGGM